MNFPFMEYILDYLPSLPVTRQQLGTISADDVFTCSTMLVDTWVTAAAMPSANPVAKRGRVAPIVRDARVR